MTKRKSLEDKPPPRERHPRGRGRADAAEAPTPAPTFKGATPFKETKPSRRQAPNPPPAPAAAAVEPPGVPQPETSVLERRRLEVAEDLRKVETQIFDLETKYLDSSSAYGNAIRGYEGFLGGAGVANRKVYIKPDERLFSSSSATGQAAGGS